MARTTTSPTGTHARPGRLTSGLPGSGLSISTASSAATLVSGHRHSRRLLTRSPPCPCTRAGVAVPSPRSGRGARGRPGMPPGSRSMKPYIRFGHRECRWPPSLGGWASAARPSTATCGETRRPARNAPQWRPSAQVLTPYLPYLILRWRQSGANSAQLWREIQALGYTHSARTVCRFITRLRRASEAGQAPEAQASPYTRPRDP
jgi:hypothetical protein